MAEPAIHQLVKSNSNVDVIWRAFELRPEPFPTLNPKGDYLRQIWEASVYPLAEKIGVVIKLPPVQPRTRLAHQAAHWARSVGRFDEYNQSLFRALFERGENIGNIDVLTSIASELGLTGDSLRGVLQSHEFEKGVLSDQRKASRLGVTKIPAFVANNKATLTGVQSLEILEALVEKA